MWRKLNLAIITAIEINLILAIYSIISVYAGDLAGIMFLVLVIPCDIFLSYHTIRLLRKHFALSFLPILQVSK